MLPNTRITDANGVEFATTDINLVKDFEFDGRDFYSTIDGDRYTFDEAIEVGLIIQSQPDKARKEMKTFRTVKERFADFDLDLVWMPDRSPAFNLVPMHGRTAKPQQHMFNNLGEVIDYLLVEEEISGDFDYQDPVNPKTAPMIVDDSDEYVEITLNGEQLLLPAGSTIEDALQIQEDRQNVGTYDVSADDTAYVLMLQHELAKHHRQLYVLIDTATKRPFHIINDTGMESEDLLMFSSTREVHKFLRTLSGETHETDSTDSTS